jgi:hypothetical protein
MSDFLRRPAEFTDPTVYDAEIVDLDALEPQPLAYPPAIREPEPVASCFCGNVTDRGHGRIDGRPGYSCEEILAMYRDVELCSQPARRRFPFRLIGRARKAGA